MIELNEIVKHTGDHNISSEFEYKVTRIWKDLFGNDWWYDLEAVKPDVMTHHKTILSVEKPDIEIIKRS